MGPSGNAAFLYLHWFLEGGHAFGKISARELRASAQKDLQVGGNCAEIQDKVGPHAICGCANPARFGRKQR